MRIRIEGNGSKPFTVRVPALWAMGRFGALFVRIVSGVRVKGRDLVRLRRIIKHYRRGNPDWTIVEVVSTDGKTVKIRI